VNWLRAAAIIAQIDPVGRGYLTMDKRGRLRLPPVRNLGDVDLLDNEFSQSNLLVEYAIHSLSDADYSYSMPAVTSVELILRELAPRFGVNPEDEANYNNHFRNPVLTYCTAERLSVLYSGKGLKRVEIELRRLRQRGII
jgi:hypothetical protein